MKIISKKMETQIKKTILEFIAGIVLIAGTILAILASILYL